MGAHFFDVQPRYSAGSPAAVSERIALAVAHDEKEGYEAALTGVYGVSEQTKAKEHGLAGIVQEMKETAKGWKVRDIITGELWLWPFKGNCTTCFATQVPCKRGYLTEHHYKRRRTADRIIPCDKRTFVGKKLEEYEW